MVASPPYGDLRSGEVSATIGYTPHIIEFILICGRNSRSSTWRTRSAASVGCGATLSL